KTNLGAMRDTRNLQVSAVEINLSKPAAPKPASVPAGGQNDLLAKSARRLSLVIDRLTRFLPGRGGAGAPAPAADAAPPVAGVPPDDTSAQLVTMATASAASEEELERYMQSIRPFTGESDTSNLIR